MRGRSTKLWELERAEARGGSKLNNIFSSFELGIKVGGVLELSASQL